MAYELSEKEREEIVATIRENVAERETTPTQPSKSYKMFKQYIETNEETQPQEQHETLVKEELFADNAIYISHVLCCVSGFILGALIVLICFKFKIKRIKSECDDRVSEARATLDRMISVMAKE